MNFLRKFYNEGAEQGGGEIEKVVELSTENNATETAVETEQPSIAAMLAKEGTRTDLSAAKPLDNVEAVKKEEAKSTEVAKTEVAQAETEVATSTETTQEKTAETAATTQTEKAAVETTVKWEDLVNQQPKEKVLKTLGFNEQTAEFVKDVSELDPKVWGLINAYKEGKSVEYLKEVSKDYATMSSEDIMRSNIERENTDASAEEIDALFERDVLEKYNLDSTDEYELEKGNKLLNADAKRFRSKFKAEHDEKYTLPAFVPKEKEDVNKEVEAEKAETDKFVKEATESHNNNPIIKSILEKNAITVGQGAEAFTFTIDGKEIADISLNGAESLLDDVSYGENGEIASYKPKSEHRALVATVAKHGMNFLNAFALHHQTIGTKKAIGQIENAKVAENTGQASSQATDDSNLSPAQALARKGSRSDR